MQTFVNLRSDVIRWSMRFRYAYSTLYNDSPKDPICVVVCTYMSWLYERGTLSGLRFTETDPPTRWTGRSHTLYLN